MTDSTNQKKTLKFVFIPALFLAFGLGIVSMYVFSELSVKKELTHTIEMRQHDKFEFMASLNVIISMLSDREVKLALEFICPRLDNYATKYL